MRNSHPLVDALAPGEPLESEGREVRSDKVLVRVDEGCYVDPHKVSCIRAIAVGNQGYVRVTLENGDDFDVLRHDCELNTPDTSLVDAVIERMQQAFSRRAI